MALSDYFGVLAGVAMLSSCAYAAYLLVIRVCPVAPVSVRCCAWLLVAAWLQVAVFEVLVSLHAFRLAVALPVWLALAAIFHVCLADPQRSPRRQASADWQRLCHAARTIWSGNVRVVLALTALLSAAELLRGLVAPPLAWDSLTYQLVRPALWVQSGGMISPPAPDAWSYYAYFPYTGNVFWAWAMLPVRGELLLAPACFAVWLGIQLAAYTAARLLGAEQVTAVLAALTVGITPAVFAYLISGYVDNTLLAAFLLGIVFAVRTLTGHRREAVLAAAAFGLAAGVKLTGAIMLCLAGAVLATYLLRQRSSLKQRLGSMAAASAAAAIGVLPYLRTWMETGSPLYPKGLRLFGREVFAGNEQLAAVLSGEIFATPSRFSELKFLLMTFVPRWQFTGLGLVAPVLIAVGLVGLVVLLRRKTLRPPVAFMLACAVVTVALLYAPGARGMRTYWPGACVRFLMPAFTCCVLWATAVRWATKWLWFTALGFGLIMGLPRGWSAADARAVGSGAVWLAAVFGGVWLCRLLFRKTQRPKLAAVLAVLVATTMLFPLLAVRRRYRYPIYQAAGGRRAWVTHRLDGVYASSWPIWQHFDALPGHRIAVTAGWELAGHNWYRYPLLGSRLQNELLYVPITQDGQIIDYQELGRSAHRAVFLAWLHRLSDRRVQYVVSLAPENTLESKWMTQHPDLFQPIVCSVDRRSRAYRFNRAAARLRLALGRNRERKPSEPSLH